MHNSFFSNGFEWTRTLNHRVVLTPKNEVNIDFVKSVYSMMPVVAKITSFILGLPGKQYDGESWRERKREREKWKKELDSVQLKRGYGVGHKFGRWSNS
jgi:hypothetical protein